jgi:hypothetical protein
MAWNGTGQFVLNPAYTPEVNGNIVDAPRYNGMCNDVAAGITAALAKNGENVPTANLPMGGYKHTGADAATEAGEYVEYAQMGDVVAAAITERWGEIRIVNVTASRSLLETDFGALLVCSSASTISLTLPPYSTLEVPAGRTLCITQWGAGKVTLVKGSGVEIRSEEGYLSTRTQFSTITLIKTDEDEALAGGSLGA